MEAEAKNSALFCFLEDPEGDGWGESLYKVVHAIEKTIEQKITKQKFYRGELEAKHGKKEAREFIRKGKFAVVRDKDGDKQYVKLTAEEIASKKRTETASISGTIAKQH